MKHLKLFEEWMGAEYDQYQAEYDDKESAGKVDIESIISHPKMKSILADLQKRTGRKPDMAAATTAAKQMNESKKINEEFILELGLGIAAVAAIFGAGLGLEKWRMNRELKDKLKTSIDEWCHKNRKEEIKSTDDAVNMANEIYNELKEGKWKNGTPAQQELQKSFDAQIAYSKRGSNWHPGGGSMGGALS
jgi:hypothetical protein